MTWREIVELIACVIGALVLLIVVFAPNVYLFVMMIYGMVEAFLQEHRINRDRD